MKRCTFLVCLHRLRYSVLVPWKRKKDSMEYLEKISGGNRDIYQTFVRIKTFRFCTQNCREFRCPHVSCFMSPCTSK